jgi:hypothetical protein
LKINNPPINFDIEFAEFEVNPQPFSYNELRLATQNFNESTKLGKGSFGTVYKVCILAYKLMFMLELIIFHFKLDYYLMISSVLSNLMMSLLTGCVVEWK